MKLGEVYTHNNNIVVRNSFFVLEKPVERYSIFIINNFGFEKN